MDGRQSCRELAAKCRRLAVAIGDGPTREALDRLAQEYEQQARSLKGPISQ